MECGNHLRVFIIKYTKSCSAQRGPQHKQAHAVVPVSGFCSVDAQPYYYYIICYGKYLTQRSLYKDVRKMTDLMMMMMLLLYGVIEQYRILLGDGGDEAYTVVGS